MEKKIKFAVSGKRVLCYTAGESRFFKDNIMVRRVITSIIFFLIVISFFYQYKYGVTTHSAAAAVTAQVTPPELAAVSHVTPQPKASANSDQVTIASAPKAPVDKDLFSVHEGDIVLGNREAKVVVVEYSSLTCPHCSYFHKNVYPELKAKYIDTGKIAYVLREFISNKQDLDGAILARCLDDKNDPLKLLNILYAQQDNWAFNKNYREILENIGQLAGISKEKYGECLGRSSLVEGLANQSRAITLYKDFVGTPAFFVAGEMHKGIYDAATLSKTIDEALKAAAAVVDAESNNVKI